MCTAGVTGADAVFPLIVGIPKHKVSLSTMDLECVKQAWQVRADVPTAAFPSIVGPTEA